MQMHALTVAPPLPALRADLSQRESKSPPACPWCNHSLSPSCSSSGQMSTFPLNIPVASQRLSLEMATLWAAISPRGIDAARRIPQEA